jgi:hypothetical protein
MPITRAQYISGNSDDGPVLNGQVQGVTAGYGVTINDQGVLSFDVNAIMPPYFLNLNIDGNFDGATDTFTLIDFNTSAPVTIAPEGNIVVFVGGVPQIPLAAYSVSGNEIVFIDPPPLGATFFAVTTAWPPPGP